MLIRILENLRGKQVLNGPNVQFRWVPAHAKVEGNEKANELTKSASAGQIAAIPNHILPTSYVSKGLGREHWAKMYSSAGGDKHTRDLDRALPDTKKDVV